MSKLRSATVRTCATVYAASTCRGFVVQPTTDRDAFVDEQIKGTAEHFLVSALHACNKGNFRTAKDILDSWEASKAPRYAKTFKLLQNRCTLSLYDEEPENVLEFFIKEFNINLQHSPPPSSLKRIHAASLLPSSLDPADIDLNTLFQQALKKGKHLEFFTAKSIPFLIEHWRKLTASQLSALLDQMSYPMGSDFVTMLAKDINYHSISGQQVTLKGILKSATLEQLKELSRHCPIVLQHDMIQAHVDIREFVKSILAKLAATPNLHLETDLGKLQQYMESVCAFTAQLPPVFNVYRAAAILQKLRMQFEVYDLDLFEEYLKIPKQSPITIPISRESQKYVIHMTRTPLSLPGSPFAAITDDIPFITDFLEYVFRNGDFSSPDFFFKYLDKKFVSCIFAEAKISSGDKSPERYIDAVRDIAAFQKKKILRFTQQNKEHYALGMPVILSVEIKNIAEVEVQVFEVNTFNFYKENGDPFPLDLNVDGLLPNLKTKQDYREYPPITIHRHELELQELNRRGVFLVELRGSGISSRAVLHIGTLYAYCGHCIDGTEVRVYDEFGTLLPNASVWMEGKIYKPLAVEDCFVTLPFVNQHRFARVVLQHENIFAPATVELYEEAYALSFRCLLNREAFIQDHLMANLIITPELRLANPSERIIPSNLIENARVIITFSSSLRTLIQTEHEVICSDERDIEVSISVPKGACHLQVTLQGNVSRLDETSKQLSHNFTVDLNTSTTKDSSQSLGDLASICSLYLIEDPSQQRGYMINARGKTGEPCAQVAVSVTLIHAYFSQLIKRNLCTNEEGCIRLGVLTYIDTIEACISNTKNNYQWNIGQSSRCCVRYPKSLVFMQGESYTLPFAGAQNLVSLFACGFVNEQREIGSEIITSNVTTSALSFPNEKQIDVKILQPGPFQLLLPAYNVQESLTAIHITVIPHDQHLLCKGLVSPPASTYHSGKYMAAPLTVGGDCSNPIVSIKSMSVDRTSGRVKLQLTNALRTTRVHLFTRWTCIFASEMSSMLDSSESPIYPSCKEPTRVDPPICKYISERKLSDEHRYVTRRKHLSSRLGNMLPKPGLITRPYEVRETVTRLEELEQEQDGYVNVSSTMQRGGGCAYPQAMQSSTRSEHQIRRHNHASRKKKNMLLGRRTASKVYDTLPSYDWLSEPSTVILDQRPNEKGLVTITLSPSCLHSGVRVYAIVLTEEGQIVYDSKIIGEDASEPCDEHPKTRDLRHFWSNAFDIPFSEDRRVVSIPKYVPWLRSSSTSAGNETFETIGTVGKLLRCLTSLLPPCEAAELYKFSFLSKWPNLSASVKRLHYTECCCHELDLFLYNKDPEFFQEIVIPILQSKLSKDIFDKCLLCMDMKKHATVNDVATANVVEKFLLAWRGRVSQHDLANFLEAETRDMLTSPHVDALFDRIMRATVESPPDKMASDVYKNLSLAGMAASEMVSDPSFDMCTASSDAVPNQAMVMTALPPEASPMLAQNFRRRRAAAPQLPKPIGKTKEYTEKTYWNYHSQTTLNLRVTPFWATCVAKLCQRDDNESDFDYSVIKQPSCLPETWLHSANNVNEALLLLAIVDLPFSNSMRIDEQHRILHEGNCFILTSAIRELTEHDAGKSMVVQTLFDPDASPEAPCLQEVRVGHVYGMRVICSNMHSNSVKIDLLRQIPNGAIEVPRGDSTLNERVRLQPFGVHITEVYFYFPFDGDYDWFPACLSSNKKMMAMASPQRIKVVKQLTSYDITSWKSVSAHGKDDDVLEFFKQQPDSLLQVQDVLWRCHSSTFFQKLELPLLLLLCSTTRSLQRPRMVFVIVLLLRDTGLFNEKVWEFGFVHKDVSVLREYFYHNKDRFGPGLNTTLLTTPWSECFQHSDFWPVINARAHPITEDKSQVLNDSILSKRADLFFDLAFHATMPPEAIPSLAYYKILEDNIPEAQSLLERAKSAMLDETCGIQLDYIACYLDFFNGSALAVAREITAKRMKMNLPGWQHKFEKILEMIKEIDTGLGQKNSIAGAPTTPTLNIDLHGIDLTISFSSVQSETEAAIKFYMMDVELLFSTQPFAHHGSSSFTHIIPNLTDKVKLPMDSSSVHYSLPQIVRNKNCLVEVVCMGITRTTSYFASNLRVQLLETHGHLQVMDRENRCVPASYVKVYARKRNLQVRFHKDGYTDLCGRFDYFSVNTNDEDIVELAIFVSHKKFGALIQTAKPPCY
eukprot:gene7670-597_t